MIVWGGLGSAGVLNTGGRYNPGTDSWTATSTTSAPAGRYLHTAVWTGSEMIVWGGADGSSSFNAGGRKRPNTSHTATTNATTSLNKQYNTTALCTSEQI